MREEFGRDISRVTPAGARFAAWARGKKLGVFDVPCRPRTPFRLPVALKRRKL
jgi:hypothetical protein